MMNLRSVLPALLLGLVSLTCQAGNTNGTSDYMANIGDYVVHYNAFTSDTLSPAIARLYQITRSKNRAVLNVVVLKKTNSALGEPVNAVVTGTATNLNAQMKQLAIRRVSEPGSKYVYYISEIKVNNGETLDFVLNVRPPGGHLYTIKFRQQFFTQ